MKKWLEYLDIESELEDHERIHQSIEKDLVFKGTNLWILVFATVVASVGLNMNSTAVIIGAMLISPLMGPINGIGKKSKLKAGSLKGWIQRQSK